MSENHDPYASLGLQANASQTATMPPPANVTRVPPSQNDSSADAFMRTTDEYVGALEQTMLTEEDPIYHHTVISADDSLGIHRLRQMGYEPAFGHPKIDVDKRLVVYRKDRADYEAEYELQVKNMQKKMYANPNVAKEKMEKSGKDPVRVVDNLPELSYKHHESMQELIDQGAAERFQGFDKDTQ